MIDGHLELTDINSDNYAVLDDPDPDFNRERNYAVINKVIADNAKRRNTIDPKVVQNAGVAADILSSFAKYKLDQDGGKKLEQWLGKSWMTKIYGEKLIERIRMQKEIQKMNKQRGNTLLGGNFYLS